MSNTPDIRFKGFTEPWKQRKLSDEFSDFIVPMRDKPKEFGGNIPWTRIEDIEGKYLNGTLSEQYVTEVTVKEMNLKIIPKDSLIVSSSATFGAVAVVTQDLITNQTFIGLIPNDKNTLDYWYAFFYSDNARKYMRLQSAGSTIFYIARESFENMPIKIPSEEEMIRIGTYFDKLDNLITLRQRKCDEMSKLKKFMLQKMFPKKGEQFPEIRFKGFTEPWKRCKLEDYLDVSGHKNKDEQYDKEDVLSVSGEFGIVNQIEFQGRSFAGESVANYGVVETGDIVYTKSPLKSNPYGIIKTNKGKTGIVSTLYAVYKPKEIVDSKFVQIYFEQDARMNNYMQPLVNKGAKNDMKVSAENALKGAVIFPAIEEQRKISEHFERLDNLIALQHRKCDELKDIKKYMLQNMFPKKG